MSSPPPRVLSLLSASTEMVCRLGCAHLLVGRSHGCDDPPMATTLPAATNPRVDPNAGSRELDEAVRAQAADGGPIYHVRSDFVKTLRPDVIITQEQCRICAVTPEDVAEVCGSRAVGCVLTGMGTDGAAGMAALAAAGAYTIVQDEGSSVVHGMAGAAIASGGVKRVLPLDALGTAITRATRVAR